MATDAPSAISRGVLKWGDVNHPLLLGMMYAVYTMPEDQPWTTRVYQRR